MTSPASQKRRRRPGWGIALAAAAVSSASLVEAHAREASAAASQSQPGGITYLLARWGPATVEKTEYKGIPLSGALLTVEGHEQGLSFTLSTETVTAIRSSPRTSVPPSIMFVAEGEDGLLTGTATSEISMFGGKVTIDGEEVGGFGGHMGMLGMATLLGDKGGMEFTFKKPGKATFALIFRVSPGGVDRLSVASKVLDVRRHRQISPAAREAGVGAPGTSSARSPKPAFSVTDERFVDRSIPAGYASDVGIRDEGGSFGIASPPGRNYTVAVYQNRSVLWSPGSRHTILGKMSNYGYLFASDSSDPLVFEVDAKLGYVYKSGRGTVTTPDGKVVTLPK